MKKVCQGCNLEFDARRSSIKFCCVKCSIKTTPKNKCKYCSEPVKENANLYCSKTCSNKSRKPMSDDTKNKISMSLKISGNLYTPYTKGSRQVEYLLCICPICEISFEKAPSSNKTTCGNQECSIKYKKIKTGGYREGSGRSKSGYYHNIFCGSTYELVWVMYNIHHNIPFKRYEGFISYGNGKKYYPDFIQDNKIIEIKGYYIETVNEKAKACIDLGYEIEILYKKDLKCMFDWFNNTYPTKKLEEFMGYKPEYEYTCFCCGINFRTFKQRKTINVFCTRSCSIRYNIRYKKS